MRYCNNKFYIDIDDVDNILPISDMVDVIYGSDVKELLSNSIIIK